MTISFYRQHGSNSSTGASGAMAPQSMALARAIQTADKAAHRAAAQPYSARSLHVPCEATAAQAQAAPRRRPASASFSGPGPLPSVAVCRTEYDKASYANDEVHAVAHLQN